MDGQMHRLRGVADIVAQHSGNIDRVGACRLTVTGSLRVAPESKRINQTPVVFDNCVRNITDLEITFSFDKLLEKQIVISRSVMFLTQLSKTTGVWLMRFEIGRAHV